MEPVSLSKQIEQLFVAHEVPVEVEGEWIVPNGELPAIRSTWFPREESGRLDVEVLLPDERIVHECFAGIGAGQEGIKDALENFCINTFHVLLSALWHADVAEQATLETWHIQGKEYSVHIGNIGTRGSAGTEPAIAEGLLEAIEKAVKSSAIDHKIMWYRCFFYNLNEEHTFEALINNEVWDTGLEELQSLPWEKRTGYYSARHFIVVRENG